MRSCKRHHFTGCYQRRLAAGMLAAGLVVLCQAFGCFWRLEWLAYDAACGLAGRPAGTSREEAAPRCAVVAIDERSLEQLGRWPWPRSILAGCVRELRLSGAAVIGLDLILAEPDPSSPGSDALLADEVRRAGNVICPVACESLVADRSIGGLLATGRVVRTLDLVREAARAEGHIATLPGSGGMVRNLPALLWLSPDDPLHRTPAMSVQLAKMLETPDAASPAAVQGAAARGAEAAVGDRAIPTDGLCRFWPRFSRWPEASPPVHSFVDVLRGRVEASAFTGKAVVVGATAQGLHDYYFTPWTRAGVAVPGVIVHADAVECLLNRRLMRVAPSWCSVALLAAACFAAVASFYLGTGPAGCLVALGSLAAAGIGWLLLFTRAGTWIPGISAPLTLCFVAALAGAALWAVRSERDRAAARGLVGRYVGQELLAASGGPDGEAPRRTATALTMFADLKGYSAVAGSLSPRETAAVLDVYLSAMADIVREHRGDVYKFAGDGVLALFELPGASEPAPRHPSRVRGSSPSKALGQEQAVERCVRAACEMGCLGETLRHRDESTGAGRPGGRGLPALPVGIGIGVGPVAIGSLGLGTRRDFTAVGEAVNVAFELESMAGAGRVMMAEGVVRLLPEGHRLRQAACDRGLRLLKSASAEVRVFELSVTCVTETGVQKP